MTKNAIEYQKNKEQERHNQMQEQQAKDELDETIRKRGTDRMLGLGNIAAKMLGAAGKNDLSWYTYFFEMIMSQLKQSIDCYAGYRHIFENQLLPDVQTSNNVEYFGWDFKQNIVEYEFVPTVGGYGALGPTTAEASKNFNTAVRGDNSGGTNYDAIDLFKYPLAMDAPCYILQWIFRGICLVNYKDVRDPSTLEYSLLYAHCFRDTDIMRAFLNRRDQLVDVYNTIILSLNVMNIPFNIPFILRHSWLSSCVFTNNDNVAKQYIIVNPQCYFVYNEANGSLDAYDLVTNIKSLGSTPDDIVDGIRRVLNSMIRPLTNSQAMGTMSGDIKRAYGDGIKYPYIELSNLSKFSVAFISDIKYLQSFKNAEIVPIKRHIAGRLGDLDIKEGVDTNLDPFLYQGTWNAGTWTGIELDSTRATCRMVNKDNPDTVTDELVYLGNNKYIDYYDPSHISEEDQIYNLSFVNTYDFGTNYFYLRSSRSEILVNCVIYQYDRTMSLSNPSINLHSNVFDIDWDYTNTDDALSGNGLKLAELFALAQFDFLPKIWINLPYQGISDDMNRFVLIWNRNYNRNEVRARNLENIQHSCLLSMFMPVKGSTKSVESSNDAKGSGKKKKSKKSKKQNKEVKETSPKK